MKILFISTLYAPSLEGRFRSRQKTILREPHNVFQWAMVEGFEQNGADYDLVSFPGLGRWPMSYRELFVPSADIGYEGRTIGRSAGYCTFFLTKDLSIEYRLRRYIKRWIAANGISPTDRFAVLTYFPESCHIRAVASFREKYPGMVYASVVPDLMADTVNFGRRRTLLKRLQSHFGAEVVKKGYGLVDKFILLTRYMEEKIPEAVGKNIVVEGIYRDSSLITPGPRLSKTVFYAGGLDAFNKIDMLVDAFRETSDPDYRLVICGCGNLEDYVQAAAGNDGRILYKGIIPRDEAVRLQKSSTVLVNPRHPNGGITKNSFPSKTMEYLSSGVPMIGYRLEGIPEEYYRYMYIPDDLSRESLTFLLDEVLSLPQAVLDEEGRAAREFIETEKNARCQMRKVLDFIGR